ncbi:SufE family protein [Microbacterium aureliae]
MTEAPLPHALAELREDFAALPPSERLELLLEFGRDLPPVPERLRGREDLFERVTECQSPVFVRVEGSPAAVELYAVAPVQAPTTRGFAGMLVRSVDGLATDQVLAVPDDFPQTLGLETAVSPLRLAGMAGMLRRVKRQARALAD